MHGSASEAGVRAWFARSDTDIARAVVQDDAELQRKLTASFDDALTGLTSPLETVQVLSLAVSNRPSDCSRPVHAPNLPRTLLRCCSVEPAHCPCARLKV
eukprot:567861-Rhodomonas_salina.1